MTLRTKAIGAAAGAVMVISVPFVAVKEGVRLNAYQDTGGVWTVCYGETENIDINKTYTMAECNAMLEARIQEFHSNAMRHVERDDVPVTMQSAITSFVYNIGEGNWKKSTMLKKVNRGDFWGACKELDRWVYVGRMWVKGLANRRKAEKRLCVAELHEI